jgi:CubicO group peptidase (beta-lactamase class C family)
MHPPLDTQLLEQAARSALEDGVLACQVAVALNNQVVWTRSFGSAQPETRFWVASATKPIVASAVWLLIDEGKLDITLPVASYVPEFSGAGKETVTVEQVLLMTCGFPNAPMSSAEGADPARRIRRLSRWTLEYEPGTQYVYHGMSAHWVLAELIERLTGQNFCDFVEDRVTHPLGLPRLLGIPRDSQVRIAQLSDEAVNAGPHPGHAGDTLADKIEAGEPGGGGVMTAATLALFYQALLHNPSELWSPEMLADGVGRVRCTLPDPMMNLPANRTLGVVVGAGFGATWAKSSTAFGWPGAGGQIGFAEPATGVSFAFLQAGDLDPASHFLRGVKMTNLALELGR